MKSKGNGASHFGEISKALHMNRCSVAQPGLHSILLPFNELLACRYSSMERARRDVKVTARTRIHCAIMTSIVMVADLYVKIPTSLHKFALSDRAVLPSLRVPLGQMRYT